MNGDRGAMARGALVSRSWFVDFDFLCEATLDGRRACWAQIQRPLLPTELPIT